MAKQNSSILLTVVIFLAIAAGIFIYPLCQVLRKNVKSPRIYVRENGFKPAIDKSVGGGDKSIGGGYAFAPFRQVKGHNGKMQGRGGVRQAYAVFSACQFAYFPLKLVGHGALGDQFSA